MIVRQVMTSSVEWASQNTSIVEIAQMMKKSDIGSVPICEGDQLVGIITDRDIVLKAVAVGGNLNNFLAKDVMNTNMVTVTAEKDVHEAADLMSKHQIRRLPVLEGNRLVGMLALGDLAIEKIHINEAGDALSDISQGAHNLN